MKNRGFLLSIALLMSISLVSAQEVDTIYTPVEKGIVQYIYNVSTQDTLVQFYPREHIKLRLIALDKELAYLEEKKKDLLRQRNTLLSMLKIPLKK